MYHRKLRWRPATKLSGVNHEYKAPCANEGDHRCCKLRLISHAATVVEPVLTSVQSQSSRCKDSTVSDGLYRSASKTVGDATRVSANAQLAQCASRNHHPILLRRNPRPRRNWTHINNGSVTNGLPCWNASCVCAGNPLPST